MRSNHKGIAGNILFVLNVFIIFLLLFYNKLSVPVWLQPVGRLHPLILHFPIVILLLAMVLEFFRFSPAFKQELFFQSFTEYLFSTGILLAGITVIMGILLSKEPGYTSDALQLHKWFGVAVVFVSSIIFWCRNFEWYKTFFARTSALIVTVCLVVAGHFGADITHGDDFVLAPVLNKEKPAVALNDAVIYADVIQPLLNDKCAACHNSNKLKGALILTDKEGITKGGRDGTLFDAEHPEQSLLLRRIHLSEDNKKHMPPVGKPQLTPDEIQLLDAWVQHHADFTKKAIELPATDSLRILSAKFLQPEGSNGSVYTFKPADESTIKRLNNNYRVVYALAENSPALAAAFFNKSVFNTSSLQELSQVKEQLVSLNLSNMPVHDDDIKTIATFANLEELNLNYTDISGANLQQLNSIKSLKTLSLTGVKLKSGTLSQLKTINSLTEVSVWNTGLPETEIQQLKQYNKNLQVIEGFKDDGTALQLTPPQLGNSSSVFQQSTPLILKHAIKGVQIFYTADGTDPDSIQSTLYTPQSVISNNTMITARAYKTGWLKSDSVEFTFYKSTFVPDSIALLKPTMTSYPANGAKTLTDGKLGVPTNANLDWIGFKDDNLETICVYNKPVNVSSVTLHTMAFPEYFIIPAYTYEVWGGADANNMKLLCKQTYKPAKKKEKIYSVSYECNFKTTQVSCLKVIGKKSGGVMLFDEMFIN